MNFTFTTYQQSVLLSRVSPRPLAVRAAKHRFTQRACSRQERQDASRAVHYTAIQPPRSYDGSPSHSYLSFEEEYRVMLHEQEVSLEHEAERLQHLLDRLSACQHTADKVGTAGSSGATG